MLHEGIGIRHGSITTLHDMTNTQTIVDAPHKDLRRARAASLSLIPTTTGSATAIGLIFPELEGRLNGLAVRVPLLNASLTDCVFEVARPTTVEEVNGLLAAAAGGPLARILGYEERPLVSVDFKDDPRSAIVDALSTMVVDGTQVKVLAWYDNEWGYANRLVELAAIVGAAGLGGESRVSVGVERRDPRRQDRRPAQLRARHRRLLGGHDHRRRDPHARALLLLQARLLAVRGRLAVPLLRVLRHRHQPRRRLARRPARPQGDAAGGSAPDLALAMLAVAPRAWLVVPYVMAAQALSGIAKDLTKMSSKSAVKLVVPEDAPAALFRWVAILTGSKNALKGVGFFVGGAAADPGRLPPGAADPARARGRRRRGRADADARHARPRQPEGEVHPDVLQQPRREHARPRADPPLRLARRLVLVGLPVFLYTVLGWSFWQVGGFLAIWVIGYGIVQASAPGFLRRGRQAPAERRHRRPARVPARRVPGRDRARARGRRRPDVGVVAGLIAFGVVFALNSAVHSYLILPYADRDKVAMNVGFYYMANAGGRLAGLSSPAPSTSGAASTPACGRRSPSCSAPALSRCSCRGDVQRARAAGRSRRQVQT